MVQKDIRFISEEGTELWGYQWLPDENVPVVGVVQLAHGMAETAIRYRRFAAKLTEQGFAVYIHDHRGHGRTAGNTDKLGIMADKDGFSWMVKDLHQLTQIIREKHPKLPLILMGHSMGSFVVQRYIQLYGAEIQGAVLSGTNGRRGRALAILSKMTAASLVKIKGRNSKGYFLDKLSFGSYNNKFKPNRTRFDWLSRDPQEVDKYVNDPCCGFVCTNGFFFDLVEGLDAIENNDNINSIPKALPIFLFSGADDPVGSCGKGVKLLYDTYQKAGLKQVSMKLYPEGRHEMLNETNREEVMDDVIEWIKTTIKPPL